MDGWVTIGTKLDTKELDKDIKKAESKMKQYEKEAQKLAQQKAKIDLDLSAYEKEKQKIQEATDLTLQQAQTEEQVNFILGEENIELDKLNQKYSETFQKNEAIEKSINENKNQQSLLNNEIDEMNRKLNQSKGLNNIKNSINQASNSMTRVIKSVGRWALAIFSVRSAYMAVRSAINTVSQYNKQVATDVEYIRYAIAMTLQPIIERIISLVYKLLSYIGYIAKGWFGVNIFANSSAKAFQQANESSGGIKNNIDDASKSAKKLNKELAGFDEMNVLGSNVDEAGSGSASTGGAGGGAPLPSFDLAAPEDFEPPSWLQWIVDNKDLILSVIAGITAGIFAWKLGLGGLKSLGIGIAIAGIVYAIQGLIEYLKDPSFENFGKVITGIGIAIAGVAIAVGAWPVAVAGAVVAIIGIIVSNWEKIKAKIQGAINWLLNQDSPILQWAGKVLQGLLDSFDLMFKGLKDIFDGIIQFVKGIFTGNWKQALDGLGKIFKGLLELIMGALKFFWEPIKQNLIGLGKWFYDIVIKPIGQFFSNLWTGIISGVTLAYTTIRNIFSSIVNFFGNIVNSIMNLFRSIGTNVGNVISGAFKSVVNGVLWAVENILNSPIRAINGLIKVINKVPGINLGRLSTFNLPRLAKGGIISQPGRGVPVGYGQAIAGERGREGVIPLTDSQQMALLGEAIGKYININLTNITKLDNRQIAREQKIINAQNDFAFNR